MSSRNAELSESALRDAWSVRSFTPHAIGRRLYAFGSDDGHLSASVRYESARQIRAAFGIDDAGPERDAVGRRWRAKRTQSDSHWVGWHRGGATDADSRFKLYISPLVDSMVSVFALAVEALADSRAYALKVCVNPTELGRPDKLIVYFTCRGDLEHGAAQAALALSRLGSLRGQGVPFTEAFDGAGLFSGAAEPPIRFWDAAESSNSWRRWIVRRIAGALVAAAAVTDELDAARGLLDGALRRFSIDSQTWRFTQMAHEVEAEPCRYVLAANATITSAASLDQGTRRALNLKADEAVVSLERSRVPLKALDADAELLLRSFREPATLREALALNGGSGWANAALEAARIFVERMSKEGVLVSCDQTAAPMPLRSPGERIAGYEIVATLWAMTDSAVYKARGVDGTVCVVKVYHSNRWTDKLGAAAREIALLRLLAGEPAPRLLSSGALGEDVFAALEWCDGASPAFGCRYEVCFAILDAYVTLHRSGIVHGDVRRKNLLLHPDGRIRLIDFDLAWSEGAVGHLPAPGRGGHVFLYEPELASAMLRGRWQEASVPTELGDQYRVGALLYALLSGRTYLDFKPERAVALQQIVESPPLTWTDLRIRRAIHVEEVLQQALAKRPASRFPSMEAFAQAFRQAWKSDGRPDRALPDQPLPNGFSCNRS